MYDNIYKGKKVLVTGNQGFCGSWLTLWLERLDAIVIGFGRPAKTEPNHYNLLHSIHGCEGEMQDLRNMPGIARVISHFRPDLVIHLAAKAIVAQTFKEPQVTFDNNIMGAVNILEAVRQQECVKGVVFITTDKVYKDRNWGWGYREPDQLGGDDPYSVSKVCIEHIINCYRENYGMNIAVARAGNVIGGGDWAYKRLIPDIVRAANKQETVKIRTPFATRPWQHVLEALNGYLLLGAAILRNRKMNEAYNFGPDSDLTVLDVLHIARNCWGDIEWTIDNTPTHPHMVYLLRLDTTKAQNELGWKSVWDIEYTVKRTIRWYKNFYKTGAVNSIQDLADFEVSCGEG